MPNIIKYHLDPTNYVNTPTKKEYVFIHHTAGWDNPYRVIDDWKTDDRGKIATKYVIGGPTVRGNTSPHDGVILEALPGDVYGYHLGKVSGVMHKNSIGIELCNFGYLTKKGINYYTYTGVLVPQNQVCDLGFSFRGYQYYHAYSKLQLSSLQWILESLVAKHGISASIGLPTWLKTKTPLEAFEYNIDARDGKIKGILSHTNVRSDKFDVSPQPELINMLKKFA